MVLNMCMHADMACVHECVCGVLSYIYACYSSSTALANTCMSQSLSDCLRLSKQKFKCHKSHVMRLWYLSSSVLSSNAHIQWGCMSDFWSDPSSTSILHVCEQRRLWRDCTDTQARLSLRWSPCDKYHNLMSWLTVSFKISSHVVNDCDRTALPRHNNERQEPGFLRRM